jgi:hypothetical protein
MARRFQASEKTRIVVLSTAAAIFGLAVWSAFTPSPREWSSAYASTSNTHAPKGSAVATAVTTAAYSAGASARPGPAARCSPWDVSPVAMEAILQEMVRRGWQPPRSDLALASTQPQYRLPIEALNPDQPVWVSGRRGTMPAETGEIVDVTIDTPDGAESNDASAPVNPPAIATPTLPVPAPAETIQAPAADAASDPAKVPAPSETAPAPSTP